MEHIDGKEIPELFKSDRGENHDSDCWGLLEKSRMARQEWARKWPNHCQKCGGWGGFWSHYDPSPSGVGLSPGYMEQFDPCVCWEEGHCPRCGEPCAMGSDHKDGKTIEVCECSWDTAKPDGIPGEGECVCWLKRLAQEEAELWDEKG